MNSIHSFVPRTNKLARLFLVALGGLLLIPNARADQSTWNATAAAGVLPNQLTPPWTLVSTGNVSIAKITDGSVSVVALASTQAIDNVFFEQSGTQIEMTNHLIISAALRIEEQAAGDTNLGLAGITFTTEPNVGGSLWLSVSNLFVTMAGDVPGAITNVDTTNTLHTYRIEVTGTSSGSPYTVFYDNTQVLTGALYNMPSTFGSQPRIQWGEISPLAYGQSLWLSFNHNAAAPLTITPPACGSGGPASLPPISAPFMSLTSEGRITNGGSMFINNRYIFNTDDGVIYQGQGVFDIPYDSEPRRTFTQADGSEVMVFDFTDLRFNGSNVKVTGSRPAAILATGDIQLLGANFAVDAAGDAGPLGANPVSAGTNALPPLGGGGGRGAPDPYIAGDPPCCPSELPTGGPGGGGFVTPGSAGYPGEPINIWVYDRPTFSWSIIGVLYRPGGEGGANYTNFNVLRGGGAGGSASGEGAFKTGGLPGGHGGGALLLSTPGTISLNSLSSISADGQGYVSFLTAISGGGAGGYLVLNAGNGILNAGTISARGGTGQKRLKGSPLVVTWGSAGDGGGGLILLKGGTGVTNTGALLFSGGDTQAPCTLGVLQTQGPAFVNTTPQLSAPTSSGDQFSFSLNTAINGIYEVQRNDDLRTTNWVFHTNLIGNGSIMQVVVPMAGRTNLFFRLRVP